jgi:PAS domain S-box-containing protein
MEKVFSSQQLQPLLEPSHLLAEAENKITQYQSDAATLRKLIEKLEIEKQHLVQLHNRLEVVIEANGIGFWEYDFALKEIYFSDQYKATLGYEPHEMGNTINAWSSLLHPDDEIQFENLAEDYLNKKIEFHNIEYRLRSKGGRYIWIHDRGKVSCYSPNGIPLRAVGAHTDINSKKELEIKLQSTANRLSSLMLHLPEAIMMENAQQQITFVNQHFFSLFNIDSTPDDLIGIETQILLEQEKSLFKNPDEALNAINSNWAQKKIKTHQKLETVTGRIIHFSYTPIYTNNVFEGHLWVCQDVTDMQNHRRRLQEQKRFYEDILNNIPSDIAVLDTKCRYLFVNPRSVKDPDVRRWMIGKTSTEYHLSRSERISKFGIKRQIQFDETVLSKKPINWEEEIINDRGGKEYFIRYLFPVIDASNNVKMVIAHGIDITHRKKSEQLIQLSEKRYRDIVNFSQAIIITHDLEGAIQMMNPAGCDTLGYSHHEIQGQNLYSLMAVVSKTGFRIRYLETIIRDKRAEGVFVARHKDGSTIHLLYKNHLLEEAGREPYIIGFAQNITHLVKAETELKMAKFLAENASQRSEAFLANMSHEIRTPMNGIMGIAALLRKTTLDEQQQRYLSHIQDSANNLLVIVNDVLDLEKIVAGKLELESIPFIVEDKLQTVTETFRYKAEEKGLVLQLINLLPSGLKVLGDPFRLGQILNNIISNALKFTDKGTIVVTAEAKEKNTELVTIEYSVSDTGIGIHKDHITQIFNPYVQEKADVARKYGGTGLGLSICKNLVEIQGGKMSVVSEPRIGSVFSFTIPYIIAQDRLIEPLQPQLQHDFSVLKGLKVLVAEDVELNQFLAKHILESWGCIVTVVDNGEKAVDFMKENRADIILMDIQMPVMNGMQAAGKIRKLPKPAGITPIVALTANALRGDSESIFWQEWTAICRNRFQRSNFLL